METTEEYIRPPLVEFVAVAEAIAAVVVVFVEVVADVVVTVDVDCALAAAAWDGADPSWAPFAEPDQSHPPQHRWDRHPPGGGGAAGLGSSQVPVQGLAPWGRSTTQNQSSLQGEEASNIQNCNTKSVLFSSKS